MSKRYKKIDVLNYHDQNPCPWIEQDNDHVNGDDVVDVVDDDDDGHPQEDDPNASPGVEQAAKKEFFLRRR